MKPELISWLKKGFNCIVPVITVTKKTGVMLSSPGEILLALYDGAIGFKPSKCIAIEGNDPGTKGQKIGSVMASPH